jgi:hypothetical protein
LDITSEVVADSNTQPVERDAMGPVAALRAIELAVSATARDDASGFETAAHVVSALDPDAVAKLRGDGLDEPR